MKKNLIISRLSFLLASLCIVTNFFLTITLNFVDVFSTNSYLWIDNCTSIAQLQTYETYNEQSEKEIWIDISTAEQLAFFCKKINSNQGYGDCNIRLTNNIDLSGQKDLSGNLITALYWTPIKKFTKVFDGQGFSILNMVINYQATDKFDDIGFIGELWGTIKDVNFVDCKIQGSNLGRSISFVAGYVNGATIENCSLVFKEVVEPIQFTTLNNSEDLWFGGIAGYINASGDITSIIKSCFVNNLTGKDLLFNLSKFISKLSKNINSCVFGSVVGGVYNKASITLCGSDATINNINKCNTVYVGGVVGYITDTVSLSSCYNMGNISVSPSSSTIERAYVGGIVGRSNSTNDISNCFNKGLIRGSTINREDNIYWEEEITLNKAYLLRQFRKTTEKSFGILGGKIYTTKTYCDALLPGWTTNHVVLNDGSLVQLTNDSKSKYMYGNYAGNQKSYTTTYGNHCFKGGIAGYVSQGISINSCYNKGEIVADGSRMSNRWVIKYKFMQGDTDLNWDNRPFGFEFMCEQIIDYYYYTIGNIYGNFDNSLTCNNCCYEDAIQAINAVVAYKQNIYYDGNNYNDTENMAGNKILAINKYPYALRFYARNSDDEENNKKTTYLYLEDMINLIDIPLVEISSAKKLYQQGNQGIGLLNLNNNSVWAQDANINNGDPYIKEMYWKENNSEPLYESGDYELDSISGSAILKSAFIKQGIEEFTVADNLVDENGNKYNVTIIDEGIFDIYVNLKKITLPETINEIKYNYFSDNLQVIVFKGTKHQWHQITNSARIPSTCIIKCNDGWCTG